MSADQRDPKESSPSSAETPPYYTRIRLEDHPHMRDVEIRLREATEAVAVIKENIKTLQEEDRKHLDSKSELLRKLDNLTGVDSGIERQMASTTSSLDTLKKFIIPLISIANIAAMSFLLYAISSISKQNETLNLKIDTFFTEYNKNEAIRIQYISEVKKYIDKVDKLDDEVDKLKGRAPRR